MTVSNWKIGCTMYVKIEDDFA